MCCSCIPIGHTTCVVNILKFVPRDNVSLRKETKICNVLHATFLHLYVICQIQMLEGRHVVLDHCDAPKTCFWGDIKNYSFFKTSKDFNFDLIRPLDMFPVFHWLVQISCSKP